MIGVLGNRCCFCGRVSSLLISSHRQASKQNKLQKSVERTIERFQTRVKLKRKFYDSTNLAKSSISSVQLSSGKIKGKVNKNITLRQHCRQNILIREIQELIDSGIISEDLQKLDIELTSSSIHSNNTCHVYWESLGHDQDALIQSTLNSHSGHIRHVLMHSHVMGKIPVLSFQMDESVVEQQRLDKIFEELNLDNHDETEEVDNPDLHSLNEVENLAETESSATMRMFGIDQDKLTRKIMARRGNINLVKPEVCA